MLLSLYILLQAFVPFLNSHQEEQSIHIELLLNDQPLELGQAVYVPEVADTVQIERFKFYVSEVQFWEGEKQIGLLPQRHILIDAEKPESMHVKLPAGMSPYNRITFFLGIDSLTNVSGALGGDLDPTLGMYWTWQSGYINFKLEGRAQRCPARKHTFQFHIGGYQAPWNSLQEVELAVDRGKELVVQVDLNRFFAQFNLKETYQVMSPNEEAMEIAAMLPAIFSIKR
jgi:hypothetical protein